MLLDVGWVLVCLARCRTGHVHNNHISAKWDWLGYTTSTVRDICTFAVLFSVSRPFCRFTLDYEGHFVLCCKEKLEPLDRGMANFKRSYVCMISAVICTTLFNSKRSLMSFWTKESLSLSQTESGKSMIRDGSLCQRGAAQSTIRGLFPPWYNPLRCPPPLRRKKLGEGGGGVVKVETENWEVRFRNCEFAVSECQLWLLNCQLRKWLLHLVSLNLKFSLKKSTFSLELLLLETDFRIWVLTFNGHSRPLYQTEPP